MSELRRFPMEIAALRKRREELVGSLDTLRRERDLETRAEEKLRQDTTIRTREARLAEVEQDLRPIELVARADELELKHSWAAAVAAWKKIERLEPTVVEPAIEIARVRAREKIDARLLELTRGVMKRRREISPVLKEVTSSLQQGRTTGLPEEETLILIQEFLDGTLGADSFISEWRDLTTQRGAPLPEVPSYKVLAGRLRRGEMALLLGSEVACAFDNRHPNCTELAGRLAGRVAGTEPGETQLGEDLATVGEYYHLSEYGRSTLVRHLRELLPAASEIPFYALLARIGAPLVVVSSAWDELLEDAFRAAGKPFAELLPLVGGSGPAAAKDLALERSDRDGEELIAADALSGLRLIDNGYSLIYKARGAIAPEGGGRERPASALTLAERDHFAFARRQDTLVPSHLTRLLADRGLLIVGFAARQWEDRLLLDAVLDKRQSREKPYVVRAPADQFERAFWHEHAKRYAVALPELVAGLETHLGRG